MDKYSFFAANFLPTPEYLQPPKNRACVGCGVALAVRLIGKVVESYIDDAVYERSNVRTVFKGKTDMAFLKIKKGESRVVFCLDDEPKGGIDSAFNKAMPGQAVEAGLEYVATACPSYPFDLIEKTRKALKVAGNSYIHVLCPCPSGWSFDTADTIKVGLKAVESLAFPLYEVENGVYALTNKTLKPRPVSDYLKAQNRFSRLKDKEIAAVNGLVAKEYKKLFGAA